MVYPYLIFLLNGDNRFIIIAFHTINAIYQFNFIAKGINIIVLLIIEPRDYCSHFAGYLF